MRWVLLAVMMTGMSCTNRRSGEENDQYSRSFLSLRSVVVTELGVDFAGLTKCGVSVEVRNSGPKKVAVFVDLSLADGYYILEDVVCDYDGCSGGEQAMLMGDVPARGSVVLGDAFSVVRAKSSALHTACPSIVTFIGRSNTVEEDAP